MTNSWVLVRAFAHRFRQDSWLARLAWREPLLGSLIAIGAAVAPAPAQCQQAISEHATSGHVIAELVSEHQALVPGQPADLGLRLVHQPLWHTYWTVPGDAGLPTRLSWKLPPGFSAGPLQWPVPQLLRVASLANYGYDGTVLLPVAIAVPATAVPGSKVRLAARADWLVCKDVCIPESADLSLELPVASAGHAAPGRYQEEFAAARVRIPQPGTLKQAHASLDGTRIELTFEPERPVDRLEFFPLEPMRVQAAAAQRMKVAGSAATLELQAEQPVAADFKVLRGVLVGNGGPGRSDQAGAGWASVIDIPLAPAFALRASAGTPASAVIGAGMGKPAPGPAATGEPALGRAAAGEPAPGPRAIAGEAASVSVSVSAASVAGAPVGLMSWILALVSAFAGGLILNLMPCVFPVLSLKLLALVQHRTRGDPSLAAHGLAFTAGVVASLVLLAGVLVALRAGGSQLGWGFQLQAPIVVGFLTALFFGIGLNLLGTFEVSLGTSLINSRAAQSLDDHHLRGSFATGVLAVLVASPCTAPFMGAALGYALAQPAAVALSVFAMLGVGMAAPYLALTLAPSLLQRLPRPGPWMQHLRQLMAFPMFVTCVWLLWVLAQQIDVDALALVLGALVALGLAAWSAGRAQQGSRAFGWVGTAAAVLSAVVMIAATGQGTMPQARAATQQPDAQGWADWSPPALSQALARGPVFVDFTAAWCMTCQANKRLVLHSSRVATAFADRHVTLLKADWTNRNDAIAHELARFGRSGVPLYVLYDSTGRPRVLPEILTETVVLDALSQL